MVAAQVREATGIPGTSVRTTWLCRDKPSMKEALRRAGVPTAASAAVDHAARGVRLRGRGGLPARSSSPVTAPAPRTPCGSTATTELAARADRLRLARRGLDRHRGVRRGPRGLLRHHRARRPRGARLGRRTTTRTSSRRCARAGSRRSSSRRTASTRPPFYGEVREMGQRVIEALGIGTSATHMEWFYGPKGLKFSEIGARPPGVGAWDLYSASNDVDVYREWAHVITHGTADQPMRRRYAAGIVALRPDRDGQVVGLQRHRRDPCSLQRVGHRRALPARRAPHPAGRGRLHGQRLGPDAPPRLRHPARDARRRRRDRPRLRRLTSWAPPSCSDRSAS